MINEENMRSKMILSAIFRFKSLIILLLSLGAAGIISGAFPEMRTIIYGVSILPYLISLGQSLFGSKFREEFNRKEKVKKIQDLNYNCLRLAAEAKKRIATSQNPKLRKVLKDKDDIVNSYFNGEKSFLKEKIVEQTLNLVASYIKLLTNFSVRSKELENINLSDIAERINLNNRKINFEKDPHRLDDLRKVIEMDEKILSRMKDEKKNLDGVSSKLDYMSSTVNMFKHQIMSSIETEDMLEQLQSAVNEAEALDAVLDDRRKNRINL